MGTGREVPARADGKTVRPQNKQCAKENIRQVWWNFVVTCENNLCLQWRLIIELKDIQDIQEEVKSMEPCIGVLWCRKVYVTMVFVDAPRGPTMQQETRILCEWGINRLQRS